MAQIHDLPLGLRLFLRTYRWRKIDPIPWAPLTTPLAKARLALVSAAGLVLPGQAPFDGAVKGGDFSYREIPCETCVESLIDTHRSRSFDHSGVARDRNLGFPLDRLRTLVEAGRIGELNRRHLSFMGSITAPARLVQKTAPEAATKLREDGVSAALLVPV